MHTVTSDSIVFPYVFVRRWFAPAHSDYPLHPVGVYRRALVADVSAYGLNINRSSAPRLRELLVRRLPSSSCSCPVAAATVRRSLRVRRSGEVQPPTR